MDLVTPEGMRRADRRTIEGGTLGRELMEAAGRAVAEETWCAFPHGEWSLVALCGSGNNGGDGFVAARELRQRYGRVVAHLAGSLDRLKGDAREAAEAYLRSGGDVVAPTEAELLRGALGPRTVVVDALLGTGTSGEVRGLYRELLGVVAAFDGPVVAVDAPSGLDMQTGRLLGPVPRAALTVTFGAAKLGHVLGEGPDFTGRLVVRDIGLDRSALEEAARRTDSARILEPEEAETLLPVPSRRAHKRAVGVVAVVAGSRAYSGAALLTCSGALRGGAGLLHAVVAADLKLPLTAVLPEAIVTPVPVPDGFLRRADLEALVAGLRGARPDSVVVGPGLGSAEETFALVRNLVPALSADLPSKPALLLDADGLNAFAGRRRQLRDAAGTLRLAITPHPGELGRLLELSARDVDERRVELAREAAEELGCAVLLKGAPTVVAAPGRRTVINVTGNQGLARGGTGDLLSGIAGAFLAKRLDAFDALALGAFVHGLAADVARAELGTVAMTAVDVGARLAAALRALERRETRTLLQAVGSAAARLGRPAVSGAM